MLLEKKILDKIISIFEIDKSNINQNYCEYLLVKLKTLDHALINKEKSTININDKKYNDIYNKFKDKRNLILGFTLINSYKMFKKYKTSLNENLNKKIIYDISNKVTNYSYNFISYYEDIIFPKIRNELCNFFNYRLQ
tara:strand:- start:574 stop:987 length:414 start_codon:yes stop_codon:yes gene_type:complete